MSTSIILAGGKSSRMGTPKALLPFDDEPLIAHIVRSLGAQFNEVIVVAAPGQDLPAMPVTIVRDDVAFQGPVGGICYGLRAASGDVCFVTSCDSAFLNRQLIEHLVSAGTDYDVVVPRWEGRLQPLHAVYRRRILPVVERQLASAELRPVSLYDRVSTLVVEEAEIRRIDPEGLSFFNMNTPDDYAAALERWRSRRGHPEAPVTCTVELFGVARLLAKTGAVSLALPPGATIGDVFAALGERLPELTGTVINRDGTSLVDGYACNVNGLDFVRSPQAAVRHGDSIVILAADAGG